MKKAITCTINLLLAFSAIWLSLSIANAQSMTIKGINTGMSLSEAYAELKRRGFECEEEICSLDGVPRQAIVYEAPGNKFERIIFGCAALNICGDAHDQVSIWNALIDSGIILKDNILPFIYMSPEGDLISLDWDKRSEPWQRVVKLVVSEEKLRSTPNFD